MFVSNLTTLLRVVAFTNLKYEKSCDGSQTLSCYSSKIALPHKAILKYTLVHSTLQSTDTGQRAICVMVSLFCLFCRCPAGL